MKRKKQNINLFDSLDLDSLMDIITCTVGLMLFIVIFAVLEASGSRFAIYTPIVKDPPIDSKRKLFLCRDGKIFLIDFSPAIEELLGKSKVTYDNAPSIVRNANAKNVEDAFFTYALKYNEWEEGGWWNKSKYRSILLVVRKKNNSVGETVEQLECATSKIANLISSFDKNKSWISFSVDENSLDVFRLARKMCSEKGFMTGWDPGYIDFPLKFTIVGGENHTPGKYDPRPQYSKPQ